LRLRSPNYIYIYLPLFLSMRSSSSRIARPSIAPPSHRSRHRVVASPDAPKLAPARHLFAGWVSPRRVMPISRSRPPSSCHPLLPTPPSSIAFQRRAERSGRRLGGGEGRGEGMLARRGRAYVVARLFIVIARGFSERTQRLPPLPPSLPPPPHSPRPASPRLASPRLASSRLASLRVRMLRAMRRRKRARALARGRRRSVSIGGPRSLFRPRAPIALIPLVAAIRRGSLRAARSRSGRDREAENGSGGITTEMVALSRGLNVSATSVTPSAMRALLIYPSLPRARRASDPSRERKREM